MAQALLCVCDVVDKGVTTTAVARPSNDISTSISSRLFGLFAIGRDVGCTPAFGAAGACPTFFIWRRGTTVEPKAESGGRVIGEGAAIPSYGIWVSAVSSPSGVLGGAPRPPEGFPLFLALRMASSDTIILSSLLCKGVLVCVCALMFFLWALLPEIEID